MRRGTRRSGGSEAEATAPTGTPARGVLLAMQIRLRDNGNTIYLAMIWDGVCRQEVS